MPVLTIGRKIDGIAGMLQRRFQLRAQRGLILERSESAFSTIFLLYHPRIGVRFLPRQRQADAIGGRAPGRLSPDHAAPGRSQRERPMTRPVRASTST